MFSVIGLVAPHRVPPQKSSTPRFWGDRHHLLAATVLSLQATRRLFFLYGFSYITATYSPQCTRCLDTASSLAPMGACLSHAAYSSAGLPVHGNACPPPHHQPLPCRTTPRRSALGAATGRRARGQPVARVRPGGPERVRAAPIFCHTAVAHDPSREDFRRLHAAPERARRGARTPGRGPPADHSLGATRGGEKPDRPKGRRGRQPPVRRCAGAASRTRRSARHPLARQRRPHALGAAAFLPPSDDPAAGSSTSKSCRPRSRWSKRRSISWSSTARSASTSCPRAHR